LTREPRRIGYGEKKGLVCPQCECRDFDTRKTERKAGFIRRYKTCRNCRTSFNTNEVLDIPD